MSKSKRLLQLYMQIREEAAIDHGDRQLIVQVLKTNQVSSPDLLSDENLLYTFSQIVTQELGGNPVMAELLDFMVKAGVDREKASMFLSQLGY